MVNKIIVFLIAFLIAFVASQSCSELNNSDLKDYVGCEIVKKQQNLLTDGYTFILMINGKRQVMQRDSFYYIIIQVDKEDYFQYQEGDTIK